MLLLMPLALQAQNHKGKTLTDRDTIPLFRGVAVSFDLVGVIQSGLGDYGQYEAAARLNLRDRYFPVVELGVGHADADDVDSGLRYKTSAPYGRVGVDFNVLRNKHDVNRVYVGGRYGYTSFKYDVDGTAVKDPVWGDDADYRIEGEKCNYHWLEGVVSVDAKIWGPLRLGWSVRYRKRLFYSDGEAGNCWYVPGYGKQGGTRLGGTFNVTIEI